MWASLALPWRVCLEEAWMAYCAGSRPIGACITDAQERILARGRNRVDETQAERPYISHDPLAHAELNALLALQVIYETRHSSILYTTTEPCPLCLGALYMSGIRTLHYAAREPFAGSVNLLGTTPYLRRKPVKVLGPLSPQLEILVTAMAVEAELATERSPHTDALLQTWRAAIPKGVAFGERLHASGELRRMQAEGWRVEQMTNRLFEMVTE